MSQWRWRSELVNHMGLSVRRLDFRFWLLLFLGFPGGSEVALGYYQPLPMSLFHSSLAYQTSWIFLHLSSLPCSNISSFPIIFSSFKLTATLGHIQFFNTSKFLLSQKCCVFCPLGLDGFPYASAGKESFCNAVDLGSITGLGRLPGGGHGNPLQCSGLENPMECIVHRVAKSRTWLSDFHFQA